MHIHILGICGTFMAGVAKLAKEQGHRVSGCDQHVYPPMSLALRAENIDIKLGYDANHLDSSIDLVIIGNALSRGNPCIESLLNKKIPFMSGPQWVYENVLKQRHVLAVSGTHGKTTTTALLAWILETAGLQSGFLIGGMPCNFSYSSRLGGGHYFVIEADEYDTAFYDKRSKFLHYFPQIVIMNNLEFDHADIFPDLEAIKKQFQFLLRCVPQQGTVIFPHDDAALQDVVSRGCWAKKIETGTDNHWQAKSIQKDSSQFEVWHCNQKLAHLSWDLIGKHNIQNALSAIAAAHEIGVSMTNIKKALSTFQGVKRRLEMRAKINGITIYDDFAHHPTAITTTIDGLRNKVGNERIMVVAQLGSNSMKLGAYDTQLSDAFQKADAVYVLRPEKINWNIESVLKPLGRKAFLCDSVEQITHMISKEVRATDHILMMSNQSFFGLHEKLIQQLQG